MKELQIMQMINTRSFSLIAHDRQLMIQLFEHLVSWMVGIENLGDKYMICLVLFE
jgi:hypothetical protein